MAGGAVTYFGEFLLHHLLGSLRHNDRGPEDTISTSQGEDVPEKVKWLLWAPEGPHLWHCPPTMPAFCTVIRIHLFSSPSSKNFGFAPVPNHPHSKETYPCPSGPGWLLCLSMEDTVPAPWAPRESPSPNLELDLLVQRVTG